MQKIEQLHQLQQRYHDELKKVKEEAEANAAKEEEMREEE